MESSTQTQKVLAPLGSIEPHAPLLNAPNENQLLYKVISIENLLRSIIGDYLYFNRVDSYRDFPGADSCDGEQLLKDRIVNLNSRFEKDEEFTAADYYDRSRARTYACCFSLENLDYIWENYGNNSEKGKVCVVFEYGKLRETINKMLNPGNSGLKYNGVMCRQIFSANYGIVDYVDWHTHQENDEFLQNPIKYNYLKDKTYSEEKELRICLSALGIGHFALKDGSVLEFPNSLQLSFDFKSAFADKTIQQIMLSPDCDADYLNAELNKLNIFSVSG